MEEKQIISLIEKAVGDNLNEDKIRGLLSGEIKAQLEALPASSVHVGEDLPAPRKSVSFSQFLGDIRRKGMGQPLVHMAEADLVQRALSEGTPASGGYLIPTEESRDLISLLNNWAVVRSLCREVPMSTNQIAFPTLTDGLTAYWVPETTEDKSAADPTAFAQSTGFKPASDITLSTLTITAHVLAVKVVVSNQLLDDSNPSVSAVLNGLFAETLAKGLDIAALRGAGTATDPITGLVGKVATNVLAAGADFNFDDLADLIFKVYEHAPAISGVPIIGHPKAEKLLMKIKDDNGNYIYAGPSDARGGASKIPSIWGEPFYRNGNVLTNLGVGADETRLFAGDFANSALVGNRTGVVIKANPFDGNAFAHNQTVFLAEMRVGFNVTDESRFAILNGVPTA